MTGLRPGAAVVAAALVASWPAVAGGRQQQVFRAGANAVSVDVSVRRGDRPVTGLTAADFIVYDNGVPQTLDSVSHKAVPVDVTIFLGTNNRSKAQSLASLTSQIRQVVGSLRDGDRVRLLTLGNQVVDAFGWRSRTEADAAIDASVGGVQSLYDACFLAMMHRPDPERRHLIVAISDGIEFGSVLDSASVRAAADRAEAVLHLVWVDPGDAQMRSTRTGVRRDSGGSVLRATWFHVLADVKGVERLGEAAEATGGTVRHVREGTSIVDVFRQAFDDFTDSYLLRYTATGVEPGGWHELRVELKNSRSRTLRARRGYFGEGGR